MPEMDVSLDAELKRVVVPLIAIKDDAQWCPIGTAFVISTFTPSTALLLTAAHNLRDMVHIDSPRTRHAANMPPHFLPPAPKSVQIKSTRFYAGVESPQGFVLADIVKSWYQHNTDLGAAIATIPSARPAEFTSSFAIDPSPVQAGSPLTAIGYPRLKADFMVPPDYEKNDFRIRFEKRIEMRAGTVQVEYKQGVTIHSGPGFTIDTPFDSCMSGGPIVDFTRDVPIVRGLISGDLSETQGDEASGSGGHAYGSALWPVLALPMNLSVQLQSKGGETARIARMIDLISHGVLNDRGGAIAHFRCTDGAIGQTVAWV
jgi:trypsin-like peptidase